MTAEARELKGARFARVTQPGGPHRPAAGEAVVDQGGQRGRSTGPPSSKSSSAKILHVKQRVGRRGTPSLVQIGSPVPAGRVRRPRSPDPQDPTPSSTGFPTDWSSQNTKIRVLTRIAYGFRTPTTSSPSPCRTGAATAHPGPGNDRNDSSPTATGGEPAKSPDISVLS